MSFLENLRERLKSKLGSEWPVGIIGSFDQTTGNMMISHYQAKSQWISITIMGSNMTIMWVGPEAIGKDSIYKVLEVFDLSDPDSDFSVDRIVEIVRNELGCKYQ